MLPEEVLRNVRKAISRHRSFVYEQPDMLTWNSVGCGTVFVNSLEEYLTGRLRNQKNDFDDVGEKLAIG
ncbi:hypothetical protein J6590_094324 [Homalodisca vitripennis]|nr:hypothetical protein J6590_094324 [Homalodisca vitripennis]